MGCYIAAVIRILSVIAWMTCCAVPALAQEAGPPGEAREPAIPTPAALEAMGAVIGEITLDKENVFNPERPGEDNALYRLANRWHVMTRDVVILRQLLVRSGDRYSQRLVEESERLLRQNAYLYDAKITAVRFEDGVVDLRVWTRDLWTLMPGLSVSRTGGENKTRVSLSERNLLGHGVSVRVNYIEDVDRETTSFQYHDRNLGSTWWSLFVEVADKSDGDTLDLRLARPFYALDTRWSAGGSLFDDSREVSLYDLGNEVAEYAMDSEFHTAFFGWSTGLHKGWVRRYSAGYVYDRRRFRDVPGGVLPQFLPVDRTLAYPYVAFELLEDHFESTSNRDQIERTEDFYLGTRLTALLGYSAGGFGADRDSLIYRLAASRGFGSIEKKALILSTALSGRRDDGRTANRRLSLDARYYNKINDKRLVFMTLHATHGENLDFDALLDLGGDTGLRGYPLRYQVGESRVLFTVEKRYFTDWYPFRLARVGGAIFADVGRTWGTNPVGGRSLGWLKDVGIGLRLAPTRASGRDVIHFDIAFPLDGDPSIDDVQFLVESKRSF